jgi:glutathione S-transferase
MARILYDLAGADPGLRFSPYCWRTRLALAHKGLEVDTVPWRFVEKDKIAASGQDKVPVLVDGDRTIADSWAIAHYLEETYPERPSLFGGPTAQALTRFLKEWTELVVHPGIITLVLADIHAILDEGDKAYFRTSREARFGKTLEEVGAGRETRVAEFRASLRPLRATLEAQPFLAGQDPAYADYIVFAAFQWARTCSSFELLEPGDAISRWRDSILDRFDGLARKSKTVRDLSRAA